MTRDERSAFETNLNLPCVELAKALLGQLICRRLPEGVVKGMIVETEAYVGPEDKGSHSYAGRRTPRNEAMYMGAGTCYVYRIYGVYECLNISSQESGAAVLIRAIEPLVGVDIMRQRRGVSELIKIANGPSKLCIAMGIRKHDIDKANIMASNEMWLEEGMKVPESDIAKSKRIGLKNAGDWGDKELRFFVAQSEFVSRYKRTLGSG